MGSVGSISSGVIKTISDAEQEGGSWNVVAKKGNMYVYEMKDSKDAMRPPEKTKFPGRIVVMFHKHTDKKQGVKTISLYDSNGDRHLEIHTTPHKGLQEHFHKCVDGKPVGEAQPLTDNLKYLLDEAKKF